MLTTRRPIRLIAIGLVLAALLAACGSSGSSKDETGSQSTTGASGDTIASTMVLGAGPECPDRPFCLEGLKSTYGLTFKDFKPLDSGGPLTVAALKNGDIQVALLFTSDPVVEANGWVRLEDDKQLQPSDNVTPIINQATADAYGQELTDLINSVSAKLSTEDLISMNQQVGGENKDADAVAKQWASDNDLLPTGVAAKTGPTIVVGSADFAENEILANIYAEVFKANGYDVSMKLRIGSREIYLPTVQSGEVSFIPDYAGTLLTFVDKDASASGDPDTTHKSLVAALSASTDFNKIIALNSSPAADQNGFVVTKETADKYGLVKISDLSKSAS
jgi:osmoprotectant transport system substrate-binding protein